MADSFIDSIATFLSSTLGPRSAEAKVVAGDTGATEVLQKLESSQYSWVLKAAQDRPETVTVLGNAGLPRGTPIMAGGAYQPERGTIYVPPSSPDSPKIGADPQVSMDVYALVHELGHFLHVKNDFASRAKIAGMNDEDIANALTRNPISKMENQLVGLSMDYPAFEKLFQSIFGFPYKYAEDLPGFDKAYYEKALRKQRGRK